VVQQIVSGDVLLADPTTGGLTRSEKTTTTSHLQTYGEMPSVVLITGIAGAFAACDEMTAAMH